MTGRVPTVCGLLIALGGAPLFVLVSDLRDLLANILAHSGGLVVSMLTLPVSG